MLTSNGAASPPTNQTKTMVSPKTKTASNKAKDFDTILAVHEQREIQMINPSVKTGARRLLTTKVEQKEMVKLEDEGSIISCLGLSLMDNGYLPDKAALWVIPQEQTIMVKDLERCTVRKWVDHGKEIRMCDLCPAVDAFRNCTQSRHPNTSKRIKEWTKSTGEKMSW